jgi:hypothetical protein
MASYTESVEDTAIVSDTPSYMLGVFLSDSVSLSAVATLAYQAGAVLGETIQLASGPTVQMVYVPSVMEGLRFHALMSRAFPAAVSEGIVLSTQANLRILTSIFDGLLIGDTTSAGAIYQRTLTSQALLMSSIAQSLGGFLTEHLTMDDTFGQLWRFPRTLMDTVDISAAQTGWLVICMHLHDWTTFTDVDALQAIYRGDPLFDNIQITGACIEPSGGVTSWAINTRTGAVTEYQNFAFNSMTKMGNHYLGANDDGLWQLDGPLDGTEAIPTRARSGFASLGGSKFTSYKAAYLGLRISDQGRNFFLKLITGDGKEYVYAVRPQDMKTTKVNLGKGLRARYFAWEIETVGQDFSLDSLEFVPIISQRRIG